MVDAPARLSFWEYYAGERITSEEYAAILAASGSPRVCASLITGRCGSTLLASLVAQWACCGRGNEVFNERSNDRWQKSWQKRAPTARDFFGQALLLQQSGGVFWFQATAQRYDHLVSGLDAPIPATWRLSTILRRDIVAQAMSYVYAVGSGIWHSFSAGHDAAQPIPLPGDLDWLADRTLMWVENIVGMEKRIRAILEQQAGAAALVLFYEDIVRDPQAAVRRFCQDSGVVPPARPEPFQETVSRLVKQGEVDLRERLDARHGAALRHLEQARREGLRGWIDAASSPVHG